MKINPLHLERLRELFTANPSSYYAPEDLEIALGQARIVFLTEPEDLDAAGTVDRALYFKLMCDAATLAAGSLVEDRFVTCEAFDLHIARNVSEGEVHALAQVVSTRGTLYTVEAMLVDGLGHKLASGHGVFVPGEIPLPALPQEEDAFEGRPAFGAGTAWDSPHGPIFSN